MCHIYITITLDGFYSYTFISLVRVELRHESLVPDDDQ